MLQTIGAPTGTKESVRSNELVTNDNTSHVYGKAMLVVTFDSSMWFIMIP
jgi:hypothetical protein